MFQLANRSWTGKPALLHIYGLLVLGIWVASCRGQEAEQLSPALSSDRFAATLPPETPPCQVRWGVAPTPKDFPNHKPADVEDMMQRTAELGPVAVFMYQWGQGDLVEIAGQVLALARKQDLMPVLGLSPTTLDQQRKELDVPRRVRGKHSFAEKTLCSEYIKTCEALARLKPPYLCLATEINFLAFQRIGEYVNFAKLYKEAYRAVKAISPQTKVFVSFQYDFMRIMDNKEPGKISEHAKLIEIFRPELDVVAITSYPCDFYDSPEQMPINYYAHLRNYLLNSDEVMIMEIGWPSSGRGSTPEQVSFIRRLPHMLSELKPTIGTWSLLHDVQLAAFGDNLGSTGLRERDGQPKPALRAFRELSGWRQSPKRHNPGP